MVERIVLFRLREEDRSPDALREIAAHTRDMLSRIPQVRRVSVGVPADPATGASWDLSIVLGFDGYEDVEPYRLHPLHREYVDRYLAGRVEVLKAWTFEVGPGGA